MARLLIGACSLSLGLAFAGACGGGNDAPAPTPTPAPSATPSASAPAPPRCKPGGDGSYTGELYDTLDEFCMVRIEQGKVTPEPGVTPYDLNSPLFSDYAQKFRTVWVPPGTAVAYGSEQLTFPVGTIITKSFGYPADMRVADAPVRWFETRVMALAPDGWKAVSYLWDDEQKAAVRKSSGKILDVSWVDGEGATQTSTYLIPNANQCKKCHADDGVLAVIGPRPSQLNRDFSYADGAENQLARWARTGLLTGAPDPASAPRLLAWDDPAAGTTEQRARAYLEANCGYCHNPRGDARTSGLLLTADVTEPYKFGVCKSPVAAGKAAADLYYDIVPGKPDSSILVFRMEATEPSLMMPEIGRSLPHREAISLVRDWISGSTGSCAK